MSIKVNYPRTSQTQVYNVFVNQSSAKNHASPSLPLFLIVSFKCSKQAQCRHRFQAVMLFAVPPSSSLAAFFVLQAALLIYVSFHFGRSQAHDPQFHSTCIRFSSLQSSGCFLFWLACVSPRAAGCRGTR